MGHHIAVVGAGPSGIYAVQALLSSESVARVDVLESLPAPYGLLRYGVAPDHPKTKTISRALARAFDDPRVRFFGNVHVGQDVTRADLLAHYDAIVYATGARYDRDLGIPGEELAGSLGAAHFVAWYTGHPDVLKPAELDGTATLVVVGAGNVALDVSRISLQPIKLLEGTDMPRDVVEEFGDGEVGEVHLLCRRGPENVKFTRVELAELLELPDTRIVIHATDDDLAADPDHPREVATNLRLFREAKARWDNVTAGATGARKTMHFHFWTVATHIQGTDQVTGVDTRTSPPGREPTEGHIEAQGVIRAIGYRGEPIPGLPFDPNACLIPNDAGAVSGTDGREYVTGWIKRGPTGVIGTNKGDAAETVATLLATLADPAKHAAPGGPSTRPDISDALARAEMQPVDWTQWRRIQEAEDALGAEHGAATIKLAEREEMLRAAFGAE
ncbi:FAD-dependent oxidoreductase [Granulicoccus sp. GXG6511]|uniref:FAD-dependent oxidoreductase n=1 Tax=Granulicoccus sp. GXG6511 TaxID=3381351 RepID=UPI003D7E64BF